jgi:hypothetical protein
MAPKADIIYTYCAAAGPSVNKSFRWPSPVKMHYIRPGKSPNTPLVDDLKYGATTEPSENTSFRWPSPLNVMYEQIQRIKESESPTRIAKNEKPTIESKYGAATEPSENTSFRWPSPVSMKYEQVKSIKECLSPVTPPSPPRIAKSEAKPTVESPHVEELQYSHKEIETACQCTLMKYDEKGLHCMVDTDYSNCLWCAAAGRIHRPALSPRVWPTNRIKMSPQVWTTGRIRRDPPLREVTVCAKRWRKLTVRDVSG